MNTVEDLRAAIVALLAELPGPAAVVAEHLACDQAIAINGSMQFPAASVIKVPVLVTLTHAAAQSKLSLDDEVDLDISEASIRDGEDGSGVLRHLRPRHRWSLRELAILMMGVSDNVATNALIDRLGGFEPVNRLMAELGLGGTTLDARLQDFGLLQSTNPVTAEDMVRLLRLLYERRMPGAAEALRVMQQYQVYNGTLPLFLPEGTEVVHKTGGITGVCNDVGLVYPHRRPKAAYAVAVLSKGQASGPAAQITLARVSRMLYDHFAVL